MSITLEYVDACYFISTTHGSRLEFVIDNVESRQNNGCYLEKLQYMIEKEFKNDFDVRFQGYGAYGDCWFKVEYSTIEKMQACHEIINKIVGNWINKYRINQMKERSL